ncbi:GT4 family glycosyltransferase PelF [soil metagenome]
MSYGGSRPARNPRRLREAASEPHPLEVDVDEFSEVDIAIVCESTYPYLTGGLSAVVHQICEANPDRRIGIIHIAWDRESPSEPLYDVPPQVAWVKTVHQALVEHAETFLSFRPRDMQLGKKERRKVSDRVFEALRAHLDGDDSPVWELYDEGINPLTRRYRLWPVISTQTFMLRAVEFFASSDLTFTDLFWQLREFFSLLYAVTDEVFPRAGVYHAHTTGAAALLAAAAARQNNSHFLLTEHNLYTRDTINHLLHRSMDTVVTVDEWTVLDSYVTAHEHPRIERVNPVLRAWMAWWARTGVVAYRAASRITYLYPDAIEEAAGLGGIGEISTVIPNGVTPSHFDAAREIFRSRQERAKRDEGSRIWKLAYAARVVPIKGLLDLLESMALLLERGIDSWELDVMGPDGEMPDYVAQCRARCTALGLDGRVRFLGSVNLRERFGHYDVLVLPSHNEGQPIVVLEAMTMGLPTVGTYVGGMKQLVQDDLDVVTSEGPLTIGSCGVLVNSHDVVGLADGMELVMGSPETFEGFSANAQLRVQHYFHIDAAMNLYRGVYEGFIGGPRGIDSGRADSLDVTELPTREDADAAGSRGKSPIPAESRPPRAA